LANGGQPDVGLLVGRLRQFVEQRARGVPRSQSATTR